VTQFDIDPLETLRQGRGAKRPRRLRRTPALRDLVRETTLSPDDFVQPLFVVPGSCVRSPIGSMPGVSQISVDLVPDEARAIASLGVRSVLLFGIPETKDPLGLESFADDAPVQQAVRALKESTTGATS
jgi:porphobilinogen synthase